MADSTSRRGVSLAKGPIGVLGLIGVLYGVTALIAGSHGFATHAIAGAATSQHWIGLEVNGWSSLLFIAAGGLLMLGAPLHWGAKSMAFVVAVALGLAAIIAAIRGNGIFGIFAANGLTEVIWGAAAIVLFLLAFLPRVNGRRRDELRQSRRAQPRQVPDSSHATDPAGGTDVTERPPRPDPRESTGTVEQPRQPASRSVSEAASASPGDRSDG